MEFEPTMMELSILILKRDGVMPIAGMLEFRILRLGGA